MRSRLERLELTRAELHGSMPGDFLEACGVTPHALRVAEREAREQAALSGAAVIEVRIAPERSEVEVFAPELPVFDDLAASRT